MMTRNSHNIDDPENKQTKGTQNNSNKGTTPAVLSPGLSEKEKETVLQKNTLHLLGNRRHDRNNEVRLKRKNQKNLFKNWQDKRKKATNKTNKSALVLARKQFGPPKEMSQNPR